MDWFKEVVEYTASGVTNVGQGPPVMDITLWKYGEQSDCKGQTWDGCIF